MPLLLRSQGVVMDLSNTQDPVPNRISTAPWILQRAEKNPETRVVLRAMYSAWGTSISFSIRRGTLREPTQRMLPSIYFSNTK